MLALILGYAVPFFVAILLNEFRHAKGYLRVLVYLPVMLPPRLGAAAVQVLLRPGRRAVQRRSCGTLHLPTSQWVQSPHRPDRMPDLLVIASTWMNMGGATLIYLAALQSIPGELYEAAELDGAGLLRRIWHVTIPQTRLILSLMLLLQIVATMQVFIEPFILATAAAAEDDNDRPWSYLIYQYAFR